MNQFRKDQSDIISLKNNNEEAKTEYIIEEVDDWLNRMRTFRRKKVLNELLEQQIKSTYKTRINDIKIIDKILDANPATYCTCHIHGNGTPIKI